MPRISTKENKNIYQTTREELILSREAASELMDTISPERLVRIEGDSFLPHPEEVLEMAKGYKKPMLCNYYCSQQCPIGQQYVPEIKIKDLSQIVLGMLSSLNSVQRERDCLIDISADGMIDNEELPDFIRIQKELEKISVAVETLQLWAEQMLADGKIDMKYYRELMNK